MSRAGVYCGGCGVFHLNGLMMCPCCSKVTKIILNISKPRQSQAKRKAKSKKK